MNLASPGAPVGPTQNIAITIPMVEVPPPSPAQIEAIDSVLMKAAGNLNEAVRIGNSQNAITGAILLRAGGAGVSSLGYRFGDLGTQAREAANAVADAAHAGRAWTYLASEAATTADVTREILKSIPTATQPPVPPAT